MIIRLSRLHLFAIVVLALATTSVWAQDGRGHDRGQGQSQGRGHGGQSDQGNRGNRIQRMREAPRPRAPEARPRRQEQQQRHRRDDGLADSVRRIERSTRGRVINAERVQSDGRSINRIKVMDDRGRIRVYMDDPQARRGAPTRGDDN